MLRELHISNLAVIEDASLEFTPGLNVFTGQTGAGKSLVIGAFEALLGLRKAGDMLRAGAEEGRVSGVFEVTDAASAAELSAALDQDIASGDEMLITRKLHASGRSSVSVNAQPATAPMVRTAAELLVDIHGQHDHQHLLRPSNQLGILDAYAKCDDLREQFAELFTELRERRETLKQLKASASLRRQQLDLYEFQLNEIDSAELQEVETDEHGQAISELDELEARERVLRSAGHLKKQAGAAHEALIEADGAVIERLTAIAQVLLDLADTDATLEPTAEQVRTATLTLQEAGYDLSRYLDRLEIDPGELAEVEARLNVLNRLASKYGDAGTVPGEDLTPLDSISRILTYRDYVSEEIDRLRAEEKDLGGADAKLAELEKQLMDVGSKLSKKRGAAAKQLSPKVEAELAELGMSEASLRVAIETVDSAAEATASGLDRVEIEVQTNPGQGFRPLRQIASGGELSRVMLGLKGILAASDRISVLVFDEVDANVGGRLGQIIGRKLRGLAKPRISVRGSGAQQVLCITHLPQIAAFADRHFHVAKAVEGKGKSKQTVTRVNVLDGDRRIDELAEMMAGTGATSTSRKQAKELLAAAE